MNTITPATKQNYYISLDCEFSIKDSIREVAIILYTKTKILKVIEIFISPHSTTDEVTYDPFQINYYINKRKDLSILIDGFLKHCKCYCKLENVSFVGKSVNGDIAQLHRYINGPSLLSNIDKRIDINYGNDSLNLKKQLLLNQLENQDVYTILSQMVDEKSQKYYSFHRALFDSIAALLIHTKEILMSPPVFTISKSIKKSNYTFFSTYYANEYGKKLSSQQIQSFIEDADNARKNINYDKRYLRRTFPTLSFRNKHYLSSVFDVAPRLLLHELISQSCFELSSKKIQELKINIMTLTNQTKIKILPFDGNAKNTDPYNYYLLEAAISLIKKEISIEDFLDFAIYINQFDLPEDKGTLYQVTDTRKSKKFYLRCMYKQTAAKYSSRSSYITIYQFLNKTASKKVEVYSVNNNK